jgi:nucleobase:cation symporter-1, NCS1 family
MQQQITDLVSRGRESLRAKRHLSGWILPKQVTSFAPEGTWTNIDLDVTPPERRIWTAWSVFGYWLSDVVRRHLPPPTCINNH